MITYYAFLPLVVKQPSVCAPIPGVQYSTLDVDGPPTDRPAEQHADLNLALRFAHHLLFLKEGRVHALTGSRDLSAATIESVYGVPVSLSGAASSR